MNFLKRLFSGPPHDSGVNFYPLAVQCSRCGEIISTQINLSNDLSIEYGDDEGPITYRCRKVLTGKERCFQQIEVTLIFDAGRRLTDRQIAGGKFLGD